MHALDVVDNPLQWETERQNRILQEAAEQRKKLAPGAAGHAPQRKDGAAVRKEAAAPNDGAQKSFIGDVDRLRDYWIDKVLRIPRIRSALIPLDDESEGELWSKPLSLRKADIEPFASFFRGYCRSRLFLEPVTLRGGQIEGSEALQLDFPVRALFELRGFNPALIFDPPVQIDAQIEFHDLEEDLRDCRDHARMRLLIETAENMHDKQLEQAVAKGREMGDALHDALMGEGHVNLIRAWERVHQRKPSIQELHLMLTTGRINVEQRQEATSPRPRPAPVAEARPVETAPVKSIPVPRRTFASQAPAIPVEVDVPEQEAGALASGSEASSKDGKASSSSRTRQILLYLLHAAVGTAALAAYTWYF